MIILVKANSWIIIQNLDEHKINPVTKNLTEKYQMKAINKCKNRLLKKEMMRPIEAKINLSGVENVHWMS